MVKKSRTNAYKVLYFHMCLVSEKIRRVFFKSSNTLRQKLIHMNDCKPEHKKNNLVYAVQCSKESNY